MSLGARERQTLDSIEHRLAHSDPKLSAMMATFTKLASGEDMPVRERIQMDWRQTRRQPRSRQRRSRGRRPAHGMGHRTSWQHTLMLLWLLIAVTLAAAIVILSSRSKPACDTRWAMACAAHAATHGAPAAVPWR